MSLIQDALDKAARMRGEPKPPQGPQAKKLKGPSVQKATSMQTSPKKENLMAAHLDPFAQGSATGLPKWLLWVIGGFISFVALAVCYILGTEVTRGWHESRYVQNTLQTKKGNLVVTSGDLDAGSFHLSGITQENDERLALINDQIVTIGDQLRERALVKDIQPKFVILEYQNKELRLSL